MWLFGGRSQQPPPTDILAPAVAGGAGGAGGDDDKSKNEKKKMEAYRFDSTALERAAQAARDLERSKHAKEALELSKIQEITKQQEYINKVKEYEAHIEQNRLEQKRVEGEMKLKILNEETKQHQIRAQYQDQLARKRYEEQLRQQQSMNEENLRRQEESVKQQEAMRRATIEYETELRHKHEMRRVQAKIEAKAKKERENWDLTMQQIKLKAAETRTTVLESLKTGGSVIGMGAKAFLSNWDMVLAAAGGISLLGLGLYTAKGATGVGARYIESRIVKPSLVLETSRFSLADILKHPVQFMHKVRNSSKDPLKDVVLEPDLEQRLRDIALSTKHTKQNKGLHRNILLHGAPGTGKTMFAKKLANASGMDYAIMTGGDVSPMGRDGPAAIHKVFNWAETSRRGLLLFIDEGDVFLRKRRSVAISEDLNSSLNAFLNRTGEQSSKFMLVVASNMPDQFDQAIMDRIDEMVEFPLPGLEERRRLTRLYFYEYILKGVNKRVKYAHFDHTKICDDVAKATEGFSGREIAKLAVAWVADANGSVNGELTEDMMKRRVDMAVKEHKWKVLWQSEEERKGSRASSVTKTPKYSDYIPLLPDPLTGSTPKLRSDTSELSPSSKSNDILQDTIKVVKDKDS